MTSSPLAGHIPYLGVKAKFPPNIIKKNRAPTSKDINFQIGDLWIDLINDDVYCLTSKSEGIAIWTDLGGQIGDFPVTPFVVGPLGQAGYQTVQAALDAIGPGGDGQIWIQPGTYTEALVFPEGINVGIITGSDEDAAAAHIIGEHVPPLTGNIVMWRIKMSSSRHIFNRSGAGSANITLVHNNYAVDGYIWNLPNWTAPGACVAGLIADRLSVSSGILNNVNGDAVVFLFSSDLGVGNTNTMFANNFIEIQQCCINCPSVFGASAELISARNIHTATLTFEDATSAQITHTDLLVDGGLPTVVHDSSNNVTISDCTVQSTAPQVFDGTGSGELVLGNVSFLASSNIASTLDVNYSRVIGRITPYVVGPTGTYETIQAALDAANSAGGEVVLVQPDTYTEDLTLYDNTWVVGLTNSLQGSNVIIIGEHTPPTTGQFGFDRVQLETATHIFDSNAAGTALLYINNAGIKVTNGYIWNVPNWTGTINGNDIGDVGSTNNGVVNNSGGAIVFLNNGVFGAGTTNTMQCNGALTRLDLCEIACPSDISGGFLDINIAFFTDTMTLSGTVQGIIFNALFATAANKCLDFTTSGSFSVFATIFESSNNPAIDGAGSGTLDLTTATFLINDNIAGTLTLASNTLYSGTLKTDYTDHGFLLGQGTAENVVATAALTDGQLPIGSTGNDPVLSTLTAGTNIGIVNAAGSITISSSATATFPITPFVVGPTGEFSTIQAGLDAANSAGGGMVYAQTGSFTENLTFYDKVVLWGDQAGGTVITGVHTPPTSGVSTIDGCLLISATDIFNSAAAGTTVITISNCFILVTNGFVYNLLNWTGELLFDNCGEASTNDGVVNNTAGVKIKFINTEMGAGSVNTMTLTGNADVRFDTCNVNCPVNIAGSGMLTVQNAVKFANTVTIGGSKQGFITGSSFRTGSNAAIVYNSSGDVSIATSEIQSTNNPAIDGTGAGTLTFEGLDFIDNAVIASTLTTARGTTVGGTARYLTLDTDVAAAGVTLSGTTLQADGTDSDIDITVTPKGTGKLILPYATPNAVAVYGTSGSVTEVGPLTDGQLVVGSTGSSPAASTLTAGTNISIVNASGSITINSTGSGGGYTWNEVTGTSQTMAIHNAYIANNAAIVVLTLPAVAAVGDTVRVAGKGAGGWMIDQNAGQFINFGISTTTVGVAGSLDSTNPFDTAELVCITANTQWTVITSIGNLTVV